MLYTGVDIEDISRFENKSEKFLKRIFTDNEINYCLKNKNPAPSFAVRFCAKEAVTKAICQAGYKCIPYNKIEVIKNDNGVPKLKILASGYDEFNFSISLSHEKQKAIAYVIMYKVKED